jgi:large subunit ribosomal protein L31
MKKATHPEYFPAAKVKCACGNEFTIGSTEKELKIELCFLCHPFYTGKLRLVDTARRVEKFQAKVAQKTAASAGRIGKKAKKARNAAKRKEQ